MVYVFLILALAAVVYVTTLALCRAASETDDLLDRLEWEARHKQKIVYPSERKP